MITGELKKRITTSIILIAFVLNCLFIHNLTWLFLLSIVSLICLFEFSSLCKKIWKNKITAYSLIFLSLLFLFIFIYTNYRSKIDHGEDFILFVLLTCIFSDIGGYIIGKSIGGKKLTKISPNKTISGSIGSFLFSLFPIGIWIILEKGYADKNTILFCLIISLVCQSGDLIISYFKRLAKVKDTGKFLPGHGGMLDRIDGIIFALPTAVLIGSQLV